MSETRPEKSPATDARSAARGWVAAVTSHRAAVVIAALVVVAVGGALGVWLGDGDELAQDAGGGTPTAQSATSADTPPPPAVGSTTPAIASPLPAVEPSPAIVEPPPAWRRFAVAVPAAPEGRPMIAVVVDDMGMAQARSRRAIELPAPLTLAFLPYAEDLAEQTEAARRAGHELIVHIPMEPESTDEDTGPNALLTGLEDDELRRRIDWNLGRFEAYVGVSNHMGSRFTRDEKAMSLVLTELAERGLLFLDSRTVPGSFGWRLARGRGVPVAKRDVFLDNVVEIEDIRAHLAELESLAREHGYAVGIGHPHDVTIDALAEWLPGVAERGFTLVPISAVVAHREAIALAAEEGAAGE
ncbi:MAG: divergent polysaccharide deacetylase family protein [Alphaproteobacteria bacterium]